MKCEEKYGKEHQTIQDFLPRRRPHHKQWSSKCPSVHWEGMVKKSCMLSTDLQSSCRGNQNPVFHLWHHHNQMNVYGRNALIYVV